MRIVAALAWYDEPCAALSRCVRSLAGTVDHLVAVDGRWDSFPSLRELSADDQVRAIEEAGGESGLRVEIHRLGFESQVAKRDYLMRQAGKHGDWVLVIDADEFVARCDGEGLRARLAVTSEDVGLVVHHNARKRSRSEAAWIRRLFRAGTTVSTAHNGYLFEWRWLHGDRAYVRLAPTFDVSAWLALEEDDRLRSDARAAASELYKRGRARRRDEAWA